jgi:hypothetical protein
VLDAGRCHENHGQQPQDIDAGMAILPASYSLRVSNSRGRPGSVTSCHPRSRNQASPVKQNRGHARFGARPPTTADGEAEETRRARPLTWARRVRGTHVRARGWAVERSRGVLASSLAVVRYHLTCEAVPRRWAAPAPTRSGMVFRLYPGCRSDPFTLRSGLHLGPVPR